jgi:malonate-semialdehyde dehydrogenase (acetylating)/methylmalonate-semialdehyde dehydrogenase
VFNPATGRQTGAVGLASSEEVDAAVASAVEASGEWRHASLSRRSAVLFAFRELLHARTDELAPIVTAEHGKVLSEVVIMLNGCVRRP